VTVVQMGVGEQPTINKVWRCLPRAKVKRRWNVEGFSENAM